MYTVSRIFSNKNHINENKILWVNRAKGIGILLVVLGHVLRGLNNAGIFVGSIFNNIDYAIYTFHMPLFFFLSGIFFLKSLKKRRLKSFLKDKINILLYLYILWSIIQFVIQLGLNKYTNGSVNVEDFIKIFYHPIGQMWFLYVLLMIFIVNAFIFSLLSEKYSLLILISLCILGVGLRIFSGESYHVINKFSSNFLFFQLGIFWSVFNLKNKIKPSYIGVLLLFIIAVFYLTIKNNLDNNLLDYDQQIAPAILGLTLTCLIAMVLKLNILNKLGELSLQIYLAHILFASGTRIILHKFFDITDLGFHIILGVFFGVFGPLVLVKLNKKFTRFNFLFENRLNNVTS